MPEHYQVNNLAPPHKRTILAIAHPGHELRIHGWLETVLPEVWILTDGSGHTGRSRIDSTTRILRDTGAVSGPVYGAMTDVDFYKAVLSHDLRRFTDIAEQLAVALIENNIDCVAGDAEEGYNPAHDVCRLIINAAIRLAEQKSGRQIRNYDFTLVGPPSRCPEELRANSLTLSLDDAAFARKISAARNYPELEAEVAAALNGNGNGDFSEHTDIVQRIQSSLGATDADSFRVECLRPVNSHANPNTLFMDRPPFYEEYGERQVKAGYYSQVLRYRQHMLPLATALDSHLERSR